MPNFNQLPQSDHTNADDVLPINQEGRTVGISVATLQSSLQPEIILPRNMLLGRTSIGAGGPEPITIGAGLLLTSGTLSATQTAGNGDAVPSGQGFLFRGAWSPNTVYNPYDVMTNAGQTYLATSAFTSPAVFNQTGLALLAAQGVPGAAGAPGQGFNARGAWAAGINYAANDVVTWGGQTYLAAVPIAASSSFNSAAWLLWAAKGETGAAGPQGPIGGVGATGPQGAAGPAGPAGVQGIKGDLGAAGPQGAGGATGPAGAQGAKGDSGPMGQQGPAGPGSTVGTTAGTVAAGNDTRIVQALQPVMSVAAAPSSYNTAQRSIVISRGSYPQNGMFGWNIQASQETFTVQAQIPASDVSGSAPVAIAGYANVLTTAGGGVGVFGQATAGADATGVFGGNFLAANYAADDVFGQTGHNLNVYGVEIDVNISPLPGGAAPAGGAFGVHISGGSTTRPLGGAYAIHIDPFNGYLRNVKWTYGLFTEDGAADKGVWVGADQNTGYINNTKPTPTNSANQGIYLNTIDTAGTQHQAVVTADASSSLLLSPGQSSAAVLMGYGASALRTSGGSLDLPALGATSAGSGTLRFNSTDASSATHRSSIAADPSGNLIIAPDQAGSIVALGYPATAIKIASGNLDLPAGTASPSGSGTLGFNNIDSSGVHHRASILTDSAGNMIISASGLIVANGSQVATTASVTAQIQAVVGAAPAALATLQAIDAQLSNDESAASALTSAVANQGNQVSAAQATANGAAQKGANLSDLANAATARANLGLSAVAASGSYADLTNKPTLLTIGTSAGTSRDAAAAIAAETASLQKSGNLSDVANVAVARTNLGLGSAASQPSSAFDPAGAAANVAATVGVFTPVRTITTGVTIAVSASDGVVRINKTSGSATTVVLEASPITGATHVIKDAKGDAATNSITIKANAGTIDGATSLILNTNRQSATLVYGGDEWGIV